MFCSFENRPKLSSASFAFQNSSADEMNALNEHMKRSSILKHQSKQESTSTTDSETDYVLMAIPRPTSFNSANGPFQTHSKRSLGALCTESDRFPNGCKRKNGTSVRPNNCFTESCCFLTPVDCEKIDTITATKSAAKCEGRNFQTAVQRKCSSVQFETINETASLIRNNNEHSCLGASKSI